MKMHCINGHRFQKFILVDGFQTSEIRSTDIDETILLILTPERKAIKLDKAVRGWGWREGDPVRKIY